MTTRGEGAPWWLSVLACPGGRCRGALERASSGRTLRCSVCSAVYAPTDGTRGVLDLVPVTLRGVVDGSVDDAEWSRWQEAMRGLRTWRSRFGRAGGSTSDGTTDAALDALVRAGAMRAGGTVLDLGAKDGAKRTLFRGVARARYLGLDPMPVGAGDGVLDESALLVRGVAERLPLADRSIDLALCVSAFDYFVDPARVVEELARVLVPGGALCAVVSVVTPEVARARGAASRVARVRYSVEALRTQGVRAAASLLRRAVTERERPHTQYFTRSALLGYLEARFDVTVVRETEQRESTILYLLAKRRSVRRLPMAE